MELPLQQHPLFNDALRRLGRKVSVTDIPGAVPLHVIHRFGISFAARGPIWTGTPDMDALRRNGPLTVNGDDTNDLGKAGYRQIITAAHVAEIDLTARRAPHAKWRYNLRKAQAAEIRVTTETFSAKHHWLLDADLSQQKAKGYRALPHAIIHAYDPDNVIVLIAYKKKTPVAAMLFLCHQPVATYHIGWSNHDGRRHCAHHLLLDLAAEYITKQGVTRLDLGSVDTENTPGLARFKIGSGARVRPLGGTWLRCPI
ncbi:GNAT family N-acetyltransferase [Yoonia sp. 2307UL14-13]|uniref:GNAT family N-acetyltransferase n=1 Tax=Yoonia sp. 2307UL14-13 TaxID=3126506 RepID=UPI0030A01142